MRMKVILYCRVSSDEQADGTSLDFQERTLHSYCERNNYEVIHCCREDFSAKHHDFRRPEMQWLRDYCRKHKHEVDMILFLRWDRFSRNTEFAHVFKRVFMDEMGIKFNAVENPIDFEATEWSTLFNLYAGIAQTENNKISRRTRDGIRETLRKGKCANKAPRGYKNVRTSKTETHIEIDEAAAPLIRKLFAEVAKGVETPCYIRKKMANHIPESSFLAMLRNPFYMGKIRIPAWKNEAEQIVNGEHDALVSEETFYRVQEILDGKSKKTPKLGKAINPDLFLRKFLICPTCGHAMTGATSSGNGGKYTYYNCCHDAKHIRKRAEEVNEGFARYLSGLKPNETVLSLYLEILKDLRSKGDKERRGEVRRLKDEVKKIEELIEKADDKFLNDEIPQERYNRMMERFSQEIAKLKGEIDLLETPNNGNIEPQLNYSINLINNIDRFIRDAPVSVKIKLLGSMFPEKIEFDGKEYRTNNYNKVLDLIFKGTKQLRGEGKEKGESFSTFPNSVPRPGVEPGWVAPLVFETSASTDSAIWANSHLRCKGSAFFFTVQQLQRFFNKKEEILYVLDNCYIIIRLNPD